MEAVAATNGKVVHHERMVAGTVGEVWELLTTREGLTSFLAPEVRVELSPGGAFEVLFHPFRPAGLQGGEGCRVLGVDPPHHLRHSWNAPTTFSLVRDRHTIVDWYLGAEGAGRTRVELYHYGWESGGQWDEAYRYFEDAWAVVLERLDHRLRHGPVDWEPVLARWAVAVAAGADD